MSSVFRIGERDLEGKGRADGVYDRFAAHYGLDHLMPVEVAADLVAKRERSLLKLTPPKVLPARITETAQF
jgi:hypothetical protein